MTKHEAFLLGATAYTMDMRRAPVDDTAFMNTIETLAHNVRVSLMLNWLKGWDFGNLADQP